MRFSTTLPAPFGKIYLESDGTALTACKPIEVSENTPCAILSDTTHPLLVEAAHQLQEYFAGERTEFTLPLNPKNGCTPFRRKVWNQLLRIPYGSTVSYARLAQMCGSPKAYRAVARACGHNPLAIFIPCHRVIASDGTIGGYAFGPTLKHSLLTLEHYIF